MKLNYCNEFLWRKLFLYSNNIIFKKKKKFIHTRSSVILNSFIGYNVYIYNGKRWNSNLITKWSTGCKFGELTWNKKIAFYKAKQLKKKKKK